MDLNQLVKEMLAGVERARAERRTPRTKVAREKAPTPEPASGSSERTKENWRLSIKWADQAIILVRTVTRCKTCRASFESVAPTLMVQRWHKVYGKHLTPIEPSAARASALPRRTEIIELTSHVCSLCWDEVAPFEAKQGHFTFNSALAQGVMITEAGPLLTDYFGPAQDISGEHEVPPKQGSLPIIHPHITLPTINHIYWPIVPFTGTGASQS